MVFAKKVKAEKVTIDPIESVSKFDSRPQLKDGCVIANNRPNSKHVCRGKIKVCPTCSMVYCDKHFTRETHVDSCNYRAKEAIGLVKKYGNSKF